MPERFTETLRAGSEAGWSHAVQHRFVNELFAGAVPDAVSYWPCRESLLRGNDRDRGTPRGATPPTPPGIRVRTTAVRSS